MRKLIFAINITIDGYADHTSGIADDELHDFYANLLGTVDIVLFGRKTYQLIESYWSKAPSDPQATKSMIEFANKINSLPKIVFSRTLDKISLSSEAATMEGWKNTKLIKENMLEEVLKLNEQSGNNISVGGISIASTFMKRDLIDECWFLVQPIVLGGGRRLFSQRDGMPEKLNHYNRQLELVDTDKFKSGVVVLHYKKI